MQTTSKFYRNWVFANSVGEWVGLGISFSVAYLAFSNLGESNALLPVIASDVLFLLTGAIEGFIVGSAQAWALQQLLPQIPKRSWVRATVYGALAAWFLGIIPSTILSLVNPGSGQAGAGGEPPQWLIYTLAAAMGLLVLGPILAFPQWRILRRYVPRAGWWIPANAIAWMLGMPVIFIGTNVIGPGVPAYRIIFSLMAAVFGAGAIVGMIHGYFLLRLVAQPSPLPSKQPSKQNEGLTRASLQALQAGRGYTKRGLAPQPYGHSVPKRARGLRIVLGIGTV